MSKGLDRLVRIALGLTMVATTLVSVVLPPSAVSAASFTVNTVGDAADIAPGNGVCESATPGDCSLRAAIQEANALAGNDTIGFNIPGGGLQTISPGTPLPAITDPVTINGYTQPGSAANTAPTTSNAALTVRIDGAAGALLDGLVLGATATVSGLVITGFGRHAVIVTATATITGNFIGIAADGATPAGNGRYGVYVTAGAGSVIGGAAVAGRNVISGNLDDGIFVTGTASATLVRGNLIGTDRTGTIAVPNLSGVCACTFGAPGNTTIDRNVLSGNIAAGVYLASNATLITGNLIGTTVSGLSALANGRGGVVSGFDSTNTQIGNGSVSGRNIISGNLSEGGISLGASTELNTTVFGNYIGVGSDGVTPIPNSRGVWVFTPGATNIRIGSPTAGTGNVIANNTAEGVWVQAGVGTSVRNNVMRDNGAAGILLGPGPTNPAPDLGDADTGANNLQNPPIVIRYAIQLQNVGTPVTLFTLASDSIPGNAVYPLQIDIYNSTNNLSGAAGTLITSFSLSEFARNGDQLAFGGIAFSNPGDQIKLTITDANGNTSPFSPPFTVTESVEVNSTSDAPDASPADGVCSTSTPGECTLRAAIATAAVNGPNANITFGTPSPATITPLTPYPPLRNSIDAGTRSSCRTSPPALRVAINASALAGDVFAIPSGVNNLFIRGLAIGGMGGSAIRATDNSGTVVNCTFLGTDAAGVPNSSSTAPRVSLVTSGATPGDITVGGPSVFQRNLIVGSVEAQCPVVKSRLDVVNNDINTSVDGLAPASGATLGAAVATNCNGTVADNRIAFGSGFNGISIVGGGVVKVRRNNIIGPGATGIAGSTEPAPVLSAAQMTAGLTRVVGTLAGGVPNATFAIDVFNSSLCSAIGQNYVGTFDVTADGAGNASFDETVPGGAGVGFEFVTVTATNADPAAHATSPFSACQVASELVTSISLDLEVATGAPTTVDIAPGGIRVTDLDRGIVSGGSGAGSVAASSISAIGPQDTALAAITIGATPLRAIVLDSTPLRAISLVDIEVNLPGGEGWTTLLDGTDLANVPLVNLTFGDALSNTTVSNRIAALPLRAIDVDGTPLRAIPIAAIALGSTPLRAIPLRAIAPGEPNPWCEIIDTLLAQSGQACEQALDDLNLMEITLRGVPLRAIPLRAIPLRAIALQASPLRAIPLRAIDLEASPLRAIPLRAIDLQASPLRAIPLRAIPLRAIPLRAIDLGTTPLRAIDVDSTPLRAIEVEGLSVDGTPLRAIPLRAIPLRAIDLEASPLRAIPLRAIPLRAIPLRAIDLAASPLRAIPLRAIDIAGSPLASIPLRAIDLQSSPLRAIPLRAIPLRAIPLRAIPLRAITVQGTPLRAIPLRAIDILGSPLRAIPLRAITTVGAVNCQLVDCAKATLGDAFTAGALPTTTTLGDILDAAAGIRLGDIASSFNNFSEADLAAAIAASDHMLDELTTLDDLTLGDLPTDRAEFTAVTLNDLGEALSTVTVGDLIGRATNPSTGQPYTEAELDDDVAGWTTTVGDLDDPGKLTIGDLLDVAQGQVYLNDLGSLLDFITVDQLTAIVGPSLLAQIQAMTTQLGDLTDAQLGKMTLLDLGATIDDITIAELLAGLGDALDDYTLGDLLLALVEPGSLAYGGVEFDDIDESTLPAGTIGATTFAASFAMNAPGARNVSVEVVLPAGATYVAGTALVSGTEEEPDQAGQTLIWSLAGPGNGAPIDVSFDVLPPLRLGATTLTATATIVGTDVSASSSASVTVAEGSEPNDFALSAGPGSTRQTTAADEDVVYLTYIPTPTDIDVFEIDLAENDRLVVQLSNLDADLDVVVWGRPDDAGAAAALGPVSDETPLAALADPDADGTDAALVDDFVRLDSLDPTLQLVASSNTSGNTDETISTDRLPAGTYFVQVYGANGATNVAPASLQLKVREADALPPCRATGPLPAANSLPSVPAIPAAANTLVLVNPSRLEQFYGASGRAAVNAAIGRLTAYLAAHPELGVNPVVVPVDAYPQVRAAYNAWDSAAGSCDPDAANAVVATINAQVIDPRRAQFDHIVVLGGDELIPMARVADNTQVANEYDFRNEFDGDLTGGAANARNAATASFWESMILTDEPYGEAGARSTGDGYLYVSDAALGRVVETPAEVADALDTFVQFGGNLSIETATVLGYDFLADGSEAVADELADAGLPVDRELASGVTAIGDKWDADDATTELVQAGTRALVSLNAHFDHYRALPAVGDQVPGFDDNLIATEVEAALGPDALNQSLVFSMGCHGGLSVSDIMVGSTNADWAQTLGREGSLFVGNTGFGYGDTESVAYTEELMRLFAERVTSPFALPNGPGTSSSTVGQALTWAKNAFVAGVHSYSVYDEKAVMESTFYGLPFYRVGLTPSPLAPAPTRTASPDGTGTSTSPVNVTATNTTVVTGSGSYPANTDAAGNETVIVAPGRPIQPKLVEDISVVDASDPTVLDQVAHGAIVERMSSVYSVVTDPVIATPVFDASASRPEPDVGDVAFPTKPLEITTSTGPSGTRQQLVLATGQFRSDGNVQRLDGSIGAVVYYADPSETDFTAPVIGVVEAEIVAGRVAISATVTDVDSGIDRVYALVVENPGVGPAEWRGVDLVRSGSTNRWTGSLSLAPSTTDVEFVVQAKDGAGNVGVATNKARSFDADRSPAPPAPPADVLSAAPAAAPGASGIYGGAVQIVVIATAAATFSVDGVDGGPVPGTGRFTISGEGFHTWTVTVPSGHSVGGTVLIDTSPPVITTSRAVGFVPVGTVVTVTAGDAGAGVASITYSAIGATTIAPTTENAASASVTIGGEGATTLTVVATDSLGNASAPVVYVYTVDRTAPVVTATLSSPANAAGWHRQPIQVTWVTNDPTATVPPPNAVTTEGAGQVITSAPSCDTAGNCAAGSVTINIDFTAPHASIATDQVPNEAGWNNTPVTVRVTCNADLSGVVCPSPVVVAVDGAGQTVSASVVDAADNVTSLVSRVINIDRVAPVLTWTAPANGSTVRQSVYTRPTCSVSDALSGVDGVCTVDIPDPDMTTPGRAVYTASSVGSDRAGNSTTLSSTYTVLTDEQGPTVDVTASPAANAAGWWKAPVTYTFVCSDPTGVASCPSSRTVSTQGSNQTFTVTATDRNGNSTPITVSAINLDLTLPVLTVTTPTSVGPLDTVTITCAATDALSGIATSNCVSRTFAASTLSPGANTFTFSATDVAGNVATVTRTITLVVPVNAAPTVRADMGVVGLNEIGFQSNIVIIAGSFSDPLGPGPYTASVRWTATGSFTPFVINNASEFVAAYIYASAGTRTVTVRICDAGGACGTDDVVVRTSVTQKITPVRQCVVDRGAGTTPRYEARWGYNNPASFAIAVPSIPILENTFTSLPFLRGQPQILLPGNQRNVFTTSFSSGDSTWRINNNSATANSASPRC